jgi:protein SCO1/2
MSNHFRAIRDELTNNPGPAKQIQFLSISFDSVFDTPQVLTSYAQRYGADGESWRFATGTKEQIEKLTAAFSVYVKPESGTLSHGLCTALVGPDGVIRKLWRGNAWEPAEVVAAISNLTPDSTFADHAW